VKVCRQRRAGGLGACTVEQTACLGNVACWGVRCYFCPLVQGWWYVLRPPHQPSPLPTRENETVHPANVAHHPSPSPWYVEWRRLPPPYRRNRRRSSSRACRSGMSASWYGSPEFVAKCRQPAPNRPHVRQRRSATSVAVCCRVPSHVTPGGSRCQVRPVPSARGFFFATRHPARWCR